MIELTARIREEARRLGFFKAGIAPAGPLPDGERFLKWLRSGMHGEMTYLERQAARRLDPELVLKGARSVVVLALDYGSPAKIPDSALKGIISRYARGDDYHGIVRARLDALLAFIKKSHSFARGLRYVDTGPVMEKAWGARSGVGWMGKNTTLISRERGSWFFIGVILLDIELDYDTAEEDLCGRCELCIRACPAGAIVAPYVIDARRCISYLSQMRGPIPRPLRSLVGSRIYGCDACQDVCPWNQGVRETSEQALRPRPENILPDLVSLADISSRELSQRYKNSPVRQATRDGFVRNVVVALGNSGKSEALPALEKALYDPSSLVRAHAAWALGKIADDRVPRILERAKAMEADPEVVEEMNLAT